MKSNLNDKKLLITFFILYALFILVRDLFGIQINNGIFLILLFGASLMVPINQVTALVSFLIVPNMNMAFSTIAFVIWISIIIRFQQKIQLGTWIIPTIILIFIEGLSFQYGYFNLIEYFSFFAVLTLVVVLLNNPSFMERPKLTVISFLCGAFLGTFSILIQTFNFYTFQEFINFRKRLGPTDFAVFETINTIHMNPNTLGMVCSIAITLLILLIINDEKLKNNLKVALCFWFIGIGFLTLSKTYYFSLILIFSFTLIYYLHQKNKTIKSIFGLLGIGIGLFLIINQLPKKLINNLSNRFLEGDFTTGRSEIFSDYNQVLSDHPTWIFLGSGLQNYSTKAGIDMSIHNAIQQIYFTWGFLGLVVSLIFFYQIYTIPKLSINKDFINLFYFLPYLNLLFIVQSSRFFSTYSTIFLLIPVIAGTLFVKNRNNKYDRNI
ncbi:hypothetical protein [Exiguobacterium sp. s70]|uniref:hypothetical protein n=1 Tax=Exiguobacterium sp. s70 TaxID=2751228 RepID=UPI001BE9933E|nr:hypothetical protein [Exiguobacterium sp. s70]